MINIRIYPAEGTQIDASRSHIESEIAASQNYTETIFDDHFYIKRKINE